MKLDGKRALVTGADSGICRAIAELFAVEGADVAIVYNTDADGAAETKRRVEAAGRKAIAMQGDVGDPASVRGFFEEAAAELGVLVNNAAIRREADFATVSYDGWREVLATILDGAFPMTQARLPELARSGAGAVVEIGGLTGHTGAEKRVHVVSAKAGLVGLTKALTHDLAPQTITVNCVSPGMIDTLRGATAPAQPAHHATRRTLAGRRGTPEEVASAVRYLSGPEARFVTGQTIHVNGGTYLP